MTKILYVPTKKYNLLYLPSGKTIEVLSLITGSNKYSEGGIFEWHTLVKTRSDLRKFLIRALGGDFPSNFYVHNEMLFPPQLKFCHFIFQRV